MSDDNQPLTVERDTYLHHERLNKYMIDVEYAENIEAGVLARAKEAHAKHNMVMRNIEVVWCCKVRADTYTMPEGFEPGFEYFDSSIPPEGYPRDTVLQMYARAQDVSGPE
jgi:hypothetical protein